jgi:hypothetical protein
MVSLEQVKLLETKVARAIEFVEQVSGENAALQEKLESYQKRIDELEVLVQRFKEEQGRIEDGILSALDKLNQFEDAIEKSLSARGVSRAVPAADAPPEDSLPAAETAAPGGGAQEPETGGEDDEAGGNPVEPEPPEEQDGDAGSSAENGELDIF